MANPASVNAPTTEANSPLPMFFRAPQPLDAVRHAKAGLTGIRDFGFARGTNTIVVNAVEFFEAAKHYPIVFTGEELPMPGVIVGLEQQNYFIDRKGNWKDGAYVPAYVRKYPFLFMDMPERQQLVLCVDEGAPQFRERAGADAPALFDGRNPSQPCLQALEFCKMYQQQYLATQALAADVVRAGLLEPMQSNTKLANGRIIQLGGFYVIDEKRLSELPDETVLDFHRRGVMPLLYAAMMSGSNWKKLADMAFTLEKSGA